MSHQGQWNPFQVNQGLVDMWTVSHATFGFLGGYFGVPLPATVALGLVWEAFEMVAKAQRWPCRWIHDSQDSLLHVIADTTAMSLAWKGGDVLRRVESGE